MEGEDSSAPAPASSTSSPLSSAPNSRSPSPAPRVTVIAPPVQNRKGSYWWREEESQVYEELLEDYERGCVDWQEVASELARRCPMDPAPRRTPHQCASRLSWMKTTGKIQPAPWDQASWEELQAAVERASKEDATPFTPERWKEVGETLRPRRTGTSCANRWRKGAPRRDADTEPRAMESREEGHGAPADPPSYSPDPAVAGAPSHSQVKSTTTPHTNPQTSPLASSADRPFSPENDEQFLELYRVKGPAYKTISRAVEPQRHKKEVNERLDYLLQPYDFSSLFPSSTELDVA